MNKLLCKSVKKCLGPMKKQRVWLRRKAQSFTVFLQEVLAVAKFLLS